MNIEQAVIENLKQLPLNEQQEVLNFTQFLKQKHIPSIHHSNLNPQQKVEKWLEFVATLPQNSANLSDEALHR